MANTINQAATASAKRKPAVVTCDVIRSGEQLLLPERMTLDNAIKLLMARREYEEQTVALSATFPVLPWDGAYALARVIERVYGWTPAKPIETFFGERAPEMRTIAIGPDEFTTVPWGQFALPNVSGTLSMGAQREDGMVQFALSAEVKRKDERAVQELFDLVRRECTENSIYRGKAVRVRFCDDDGDPLDMPHVRFIDTSRVREADLIFPRDVEAAVRTNLFVPITRAADCIANGIPVKRGVLLGGTFGTGKTLAATVASMLAVKHGITFLYVARANELAHAIAFAKRYQSPACAIFCEDIDRAVDSERSVAMDDILNTIDGIDSKDANIITVLTTNNIEGIHPAMLRPGRLDAVIEVTAPDAEACVRLLRAYGGGAIDADADLAPVGAALAGSIPAVVAEVVKRAKLAQLGRQAPGTRVTSVGADALLEAAHTMRLQMGILKRAEQAGAPAPLPTLDAVMRDTLVQAFNGNAEHIAGTHETVTRVARGLSKRGVEC